MSRSFPSKVAAAAWARQVEAGIDRGERTATERRLTVADLIGAYAEHVAGARPISPSNAVALAHLRRLLGGDRIADLAARRIVAYGRSRKAESAAPATVQRELAILGTAAHIGGGIMEADIGRLREALASGRALLAHLRVVGRSRERQRRPSEPELLRLLEYWRAHPRRSAPMGDLMLFAMSTGMRLGEIVGLRWADLDTRSRTILIRDRKHPRQKEGNDQRVPLLRGPVTLAGAIVDPMEIVERQPRGGELIFPCRSMSISVLWCAATAACGIVGLTFYDLRHEAASRLLEAGYAVEQVALVTGHRDWNMLRRYTQLRPESLHRPAGVVPFARPAAVA